MLALRWFRWLWLLPQRLRWRSEGEDSLNFKKEDIGRVCAVYSRRSYYGRQVAVVERDGALIGIAMKAIPRSIPWIVLCGYSFEKVGETEPIKRGWLPIASRWLALATAAKLHQQSGTTA